jgi:hypothetical protein
MTILLIDDLRSFRDGREAMIARTSQAGLKALEQLEGQSLKSIWLDHDLGEFSDGTVDSIMVVVDKLCELAFSEKPVPVETIYVHTSNPVGRDQMLQSLRRWGYNAKAAQADDYLIAWDIEQGPVPVREGETWIQVEDRCGCGCECC